MVSAPYPRVIPSFSLTAVNRNDGFVGQVAVTMTGEERVIWESDPVDTPTTAYQLAEDRFVGAMKVLILG